MRTVVPIAVQIGQWASEQSHRKLVMRSRQSLVGGYQRDSSQSYSVGVQVTESGGRAKQLRLAAIFGKVFAQYSDIARCPSSDHKTETTTVLQ